MRRSGAAAATQGLPGNTHAASQGPLAWTASKGWFLASATEGRVWVSGLPREV